ncbi:transcription termination factor Rho [Galbitalea sp. SE-J8]|uniref:transcription termination factor Rho n=1 Tax=Galbitalea sp. SE-J8 TaxID=3054952 RepID=UPI00259CE91E|nr:transcription termination factor Rho [Galbitalea sp. SE-J8]MDM4763443.1 transcription termination factor Rho [Galbitalea sp. SE-J8]
MTDVDARRTGDTADLTALRIPELVKLAGELGIVGASKLRKGELVNAINDVQNTQDAAPAPAEVPAEVPAAEAAPVDAEAPAEDPAPADAAPADPAAPVTDAVPAADAPSADVPAATGAPVASGADAPAVEAPAATGGSRRRGSRRATMGDAEARAAAAAAVEDLVAQQSAGGENAPKSATAHVSENAIDALLDGVVPSGEGDGAEPQREPGQGRSRNRNRRGGQGGQGQGGQGQNAQNQNAQNQNAQNQNTQGERGQNTQTERAQNGQQGTANGQQQTQQQNGQNPSQGDAEGGERSGRSRYRDRKRGRGPVGDDFEPEISDDDVLIPIAGILDVLENYAFVRTSGYLPGTNDVYVSLGQVKKYNLRKGDAVVGYVRQPRGDEQQGRQKYNAIVKIDSINGLTLEQNAERVEFSALTPLYPQERLRLETDAGKLTPRIIDLVAPIGKGQRGLIVSPPKAGKTLALQAIANSIAANNPEVHLMVVLVDERPEEVTDMQRTVKGEVIASTFDRPAEDHTTVAELAIERAKRLVELGHDVVVLLDSITRLGRAYNQVAPASGRVLSGGVDAAALYPPKRFFGAARNVEEGGSLTIIATALVETGSKADEVIFEEFKGTGNSELRLSRQLADKRIFPAVDVNASGTRREEMLLGPDEVKVTWKLRRALAGLDTQQATETVLGKLKETSSNVEFLLAIQKSLPGAEKE